MAHASFRPLLLIIGRFVAAQALVAVSTVVAMAISSRWGDAATEMLYLPAVMAAGAWYGFGPAVLAAMTSALSYDYFFVPPFYTFRIDSPVDVVDITILFLVAVVTSHLAARIRNEARNAEAHAARNATIAGFARRLIAPATEREIAEAAAQEVSTLFTCNVVVMRDLPRPVTIAAAPEGVPVTPADMAAAAQALESGKPAGHGTEKVTPAEWVFHPIGSNGAPLAAIGLSRDDGLAPVAEPQRLLLQSLLDQTALALARVRENAPTRAQGIAADAA